MLEGKKSEALEIQLALKPWHADLAKHVVKRPTERKLKQKTNTSFLHSLNSTAQVRGSLLLLQGKF